MNHTNDTDDTNDSNDDNEELLLSRYKFYFLLIKIGSIISIFLYIIVLFTYFFFKNKKNFIMEVQLYFMTSVFLGSIILLFIKKDYHYTFCKKVGSILYCIFTSQEVLALLIGLSCFLTMISRQYLSKRKIRFRIIFFIFGIIIPGLISFFFVYIKELIGNNHKIYCYLDFYVKNKFQPQFIIGFFLFDCYILFINIYFIYKIISFKDTTINKKLFSYVKWYPIINIIYKFIDAIKIIYEISRKDDQLDNFSAISSILDAWHGIFYMIIYLYHSETSKGMRYFFSHYIFCCCKKKKKNNKTKGKKSDTRISNLSPFNLLNANVNNSMTNEMFKIDQGENLLS